MRTLCGMQLSSFEPWAGVVIAAHQRTGGFDLTVTHRHYTGSWQDCATETYENLTRRECADLLEVLVYEFAEDRQFLPEDPAAG